MDQFVSRYTNKIDQKGRVSVPAQFRAVLARDGFEGIFCHPTLERPAIDAGGQRLVNRIEGLLEDLPDYSEERDQLATALFGVSEILKLDRDGRTILPARLREYAGIDSHVTFVGLGGKFQMWRPETFEAQFAQDTPKIGDLRRLLGQGKKNSDA